MRKQVSRNRGVVVNDRYYPKAERDLNVEKMGIDEGNTTIYKGRGVAVYSEKNSF